MAEPLPLALPLLLPLPLALPLPLGRCCCAKGLLVKGLGNKNHSQLSTD